MDGTVGVTGASAAQKIWRANSPYRLKDRRMLPRRGFGFVAQTARICK
jgi:hypothetical protein